MRMLLVSLMLMLGLMVVSGCTSTAPVADGKQHAECKVCKYCADMACIDVVVDETTPRTTYNGKTYYFCSEHCKKKFEKEPAKYEKE